MQQSSGDEEDDTEPLEINTEARTVLDVLEGVDPNASLALFQVILEKLKLVPIYYKDNRILLDMQKLLMHLHGCTLNGANMRVKALKSQVVFKDILEKVTLSSHGGTGKVAMELRHVFEYVLASNVPVATTLRRSLIEIALRATAGDLDLFRAVSAWKETMDPKIRAMLMSGYVRSAAAQAEDPLPEPEQVAEPLPEDVAVVSPAETDAPPKLLSWSDARAQLVEVFVPLDIIDSPFGAQIIVVMREQGLSAALDCLSKVTIMYADHKKRMSEISRADSESAARIAREDKETEARIAREHINANKETEARIACAHINANKETEAVIAGEQAILGAKLAEAVVQLEASKNTAAVQLEVSKKTAVLQFEVSKNAAMDELDIREAQLQTEKNKAAAIAAQIDSTKAETKRLDDRSAADIARANSESVHRRRMEIAKANRDAAAQGARAEDFFTPPAAPEEELITPQAAADVPADVPEAAPAQEVMPVEQVMPVEPVVSVEQVVSVDEVVAPVEVAITPPKKCMKRKSCMNAVDGNFRMCRHHLDERNARAQMTKAKAQEADQACEAVVDYIIRVLTK